jgi:peptidoglycan/xylan/chitin deacetylase (PgdA/CDA1 family)
MSFWPENYQGAISLTFDDGYPSQLNFAIPEMNRRGLRGTFYLTPQGSEYRFSPQFWRKRLKPWLPVFEAGHEIGNHSLSHPCSLNIKGEWIKNLLDMTLDDLRADISVAQGRLKAVFPQQNQNSFAYPCYETNVGRGLNKVSYVPVVASLFVAARKGGEMRGELANDPGYCDLHCLSSWPVERRDGTTMIGLVEQALSLGRWGIFTFHGIHEGHLPVGDTDLIELLDHLVRRRDRVWVAPVAEIAANITVQNTT